MIFYIPCKRKKFFIYSYFLLTNIKKMANITSKYLERKKKDKNCRNQFTCELRIMHSFITVLIHTLSSMLKGKRRCSWQRRLRMTLSYFPTTRTTIASPNFKFLIYIFKDQHEFKAITIQSFHASKPMVWPMLPTASSGFRIEEIPLDKNISWKWAIISEN